MKELPQIRASAMRMHQLIAFLFTAYILNNKDNSKPITTYKLMKDRMIIIRGNDVLVIVLSPIVERRMKYKKLALSNSRKHH
jgi:hypothetical protein